MKRDWKIIKEIFKALESETIHALYRNACAESEDRGDIILKHMKLLNDAGLITDFNCTRDFDGKIATANILNCRITMQGYDFYEAVSNDSLWKKIVKKANDAGVFLTAEFIRQAIPHFYSQIFKS